MTDINIKDVKKWKEIAKSKQVEFNNMLGRKKNEIWKDSLYDLKIKIGVAACGNAKENPTFENDCTGYSGDDLEMIKLISNQIITTSDCNPIKFACTFLIVYWNNEMSCIPVFRIMNGNGNVFVDTNGRVYKDWKSFMDNNQLPKCEYCYPPNGEYSSDTNVEFLFTKSPASKLINKVTEFIDRAASVTAVGFFLGSLFVSAPVMAPVIGVTSAYQVVRSGHTLYDRKSHNQSISLGDRGARNAWLNIAGSTAAAGTVAALGKAKQVIEGGKQLSKLSVVGVKALNASSLVFSGFGFVDNFLLCRMKYKKGTLTDLDAFNLFCDILFFYNAVASVKTTTKMLNQMNQMKQLNVSEGGITKIKRLTKTQMRNLKKLLSGQKTNLHAESSAKVDGSNLLVVDSQSLIDKIAVTAGITSTMIYKIVNECHFNTGEILYRYMNIGHDIKRWLFKEIRTSELFRSLLEHLLQLRDLINEDLNVMMDIVSRLQYKVKEYFNSASSKLKEKFCISLKNMDKQIVSIVSKTNEEIAAPNDSESTEYFVEDQTDDQNDIDNEGISSQLQGVLNKTDTVLSKFKCDDLEDYQYIVESVHEVFIEEFLEKYELYKTAVKAAKAASTGFDLKFFNKGYHIEGEPGQYFYKKTLDSIECRKLIRKIEEVFKKKCEQCEDTNILQGKIYNLYGPTGEGKMSKEEILFIIASKMKLDDLNAESVIFFEENCSPLLFIHPKEDSKSKIKGIVIYYELNEENTTVGFFNVYPE